MEQPLFLVKNVSDAEWQRVYWFFVQAEEEQKLVTSVAIQQVFPRTETGETRELSTVRWYMYHYWRWFLFCVDDTVRPYEYQCTRIKGYPVEYFLRAHTRPNHMQYFAHFARSIEIDKALRKAAQGRGTPRKPRQQSIPVQLPAGRDALNGSQQEEESFEDIPVDDHMEEEEELIQDPISLVVFHGLEEEMPARAVGEERSSEGEGKVADGLVEQATTTHETSFPGTSSETTPPRLPILLLCLIAGACIVAIYVVARHFYPPLSHEGKHVHVSTPSTSMNYGR